MKHMIYGDGCAFAVLNFLSLEECTKWIARAKQVGFHENTPITTSKGFVQRPDVWNNARAICDREDWAVELWERMKNFFSSSPGIEPIGLNERFRFYRYSPGQFFKPHQDGVFIRSPQEQSWWTVLLYLNEDMVGGETELFWQNVTVQPKAGLLLVFSTVNYILEIHSKKALSMSFDLMLCVVSLFSHGEKFPRVEGNMLAAKIV